MEIDAAAGGVLGDALDETLYAWMTAGEDEAADVDISGCHVAAVLVVHNGETWLPAALAGLRDLEHRPDRTIAISTGEADRSAELLHSAVARGVLDAVYCETVGGGFGAAVARALQHDQASAPSPAPSRTSWLWLLHDDAVVAPESLSQLLRHVCLEPSLDVTGPKLLAPKLRGAPQQISEVGVSISGTGRRELFLDRGEINQGQRDIPAERLGVSTCGLLIRRDVWDALGGLDPDLPLFRDGVDLGWRAHRAGYRVATTPKAEVVHRQVGRADLRTGSLAGRRPVRLDRILALRLVAAHATGWRVPVVWLRLVFNCLLHVLGYLLGKVPARAWDELCALAAFVGHPGQVRRMRRRFRAVPAGEGAAAVVARLRPAWWAGLRTGVETVSTAIADRYRAVAGEGESATLDELIGDDFAGVADAKPSSPWFSPIVITAVLSVIASAVAARNLIGRGSLTAATLLPAPDSLRALWHTYLAPVAGAPHTAAPPWLGIVALGSTLLGGQPELFVSVLLLAVVPLSMVSVYPVVRRAIEDRRARLWVATTYGLLPVLLGGSSQGRLQMSVFAVALPLLVLAGRALVLRRAGGPEAWRGGWGSGLVLVALVAFEPSVLLLAVLLGVIAGLTVARTPSKLARIGLALAVPIVLLGPWWPGVFAGWGRFFVGPDAATGLATDVAPTTWGLLLGRGLGPGLPPLWLCALVFSLTWLGAVAALVLRPRSRAVVSAWVVAVAAFGLAVLLSRTVVSVPPLGAEVRPWVGVYLLIGFGALALAAGVGVDGITARLGARSFSLVQPAAVLAGLVALVVTATAATWWVWAGLDGGPLRRERLTAIPPYVVNAQTGPNRVRTLAVDLSGSRARYSIVYDDGIRLGDAERGFAFEGSDQARALAHDLTLRLLAGTADADIVRGLASLGVGYVWLHGATDAEQARIDNTPGLGVASGVGNAVVWSLQPPSSRATVVSGSGSAVPTASGALLPAGETGRVLHLGEAADRRWRATLDGRPLAQTSGSWDATFALPSEGGALRYTLPSHNGLEALLQAVLLAVVAVLAAPAIRRPEVRDPERTARRVASAPPTATRALVRR